VTSKKLRKATTGVIISRSLIKYIREDPQWSAARNGATRETWHDDI